MSIYIAGVTADTTPLEIRIAGITAEVPEPPAVGEYVYFNGTWNPAPAYVSIDGTWVKVSAFTE